MRTLATITAVLIGCASLWACDEQQQPQQVAQAAAPAPVVPPPCACQPAPPAPAYTPPPRLRGVTHWRRRHHAHHYYASEEITPGSPGYVGESSYSSSESEYSASEYRSSSSVTAMAGGWGGPPSFVDGYGRRHYWSRAEVAHYSRLADGTAAYLPQRMDPWHKYGARCDR